MLDEWTEYKSYSYLVSPVANSPGQPRVWHDAPREWDYDIKAINADRETIVWSGKAPSAARAEALARKWIDEHST